MCDTRNKKNGEMRRWRKENECKRNGDDEKRCQKITFRRTNQNRETVFMTLFKMFWNDNWIHCPQIWDTNWELVCSLQGCNVCTKCTQNVSDASSVDNKIRFAPSSACFKFFNLISILQHSAIHVLREKMKGNV